MRKGLLSLLIAAGLSSQTLNAQTPANTPNFDAYRQAMFTNATPNKPYGNFSIDELFESDSFKEDMRNAKEAVEQARASGLDLSKEYGRQTQGYSLQSELAKSTDWLANDVGRSVRGGIRKDFLTQEQLDYVLLLLDDTEKIFGSHPHRHVIVGRKKEVARVVSGKLPHILKSYNYKETQRYEKEASFYISDYTEGKGFTLFKEVEKYRNANIETWENPGIPYVRLDEFPPSKKECIPPEYRK